MSILSPKPRKNPDGTVLYKGKIYASENDPNFIRIMSIEREQKDAANRSNLQSLTNPNNITAGQVRLNAANELSALQNLQNARMSGMPVARNTNDIIRNNNPVANNKPMNLLGLNANTPNVNINANSLLPNQNVAQQNVNTQNQNSQNTSKTGGFRNFFNRANESFQNAAPIFAVAQEFRKAGAPRAVGAPMQGDPYGKMIQMQQGREQAENLDNLRQDKRYKKFANLPDKQFLDAVNEQIKFDIQNKLNVTPNETIQKSRENAVVSEETEEALGRAKSAFGITDTFREKLGAVGEYVPFRERTFAPKTQAARQAVRMNVTKTKQFFLTDFAGRVAKYTAETINNILPMRFDAGSSQMTGFKSESFAQNSYENLKSEVERIVSVAESTLQNPNTTNKEKSNARSALNTGNQLIEEYDVILESLSGEREGTNENAGTTKRLYDTTQYNNQEPIENVRERFYTGGGLQIIAESRGLK